MTVSERLDGCQQRVGYRFRNAKLLRAALTHASGANHRLASNERLEFLGDAVLGMVVCEFLFDRYPKFLEGELTRIKSVVVSRKTCAELSEALGLEQFLILGKGMASNAQVPPSLLADVFESLVAAIYLDGGFEHARDFILREVTPTIIEVAEGGVSRNYKSQLQQFSQREFGDTPTYQLVEEKGPDHSKVFKVSAEVGGRNFDPAWGKNKKEAEQLAARNALEKLESDPVPEAPSAVAEKHAV